MICNRKQNDIYTLLRLKDNTIMFTNLEKYLCIYVSHDLRRDRHIDTLVHKLTAVCQLVHRLQQVVDQEVLLKVYFGYFYGVIKYGIIFYGGSPLANQMLLLQKRIVRIISKNNVTHCKLLFINFKIMKLPAICIKETALLVKRMPENFPRVIHQYNQDKIGRTSDAFSTATAGLRFLFGKTTISYQKKLFNQTVQPSSEGY